ncbi:MAG: hypothetical protein IJI60_00010 [Bacilli bacterium]|nr:hypothetical protein [Bacilli bacterium]
MDELVKKAMGISNLQELDSFESLDSNQLLFILIKAQRYDLLINYHIRMDPSHQETFETLVEYLLSSDEMTYYLHMNGYTFSLDELKFILDLVYQKHQNSWYNFFSYFFYDKDLLDDFVEKNESFFRKVLRENHTISFYVLEEVNSFIGIALEEGKTSCIRQLEGYSVSNLKKLVLFIKKGGKIPDYLGTDRFAKHLFDLKDQLDAEELAILLDLLKEKVIYDQDPSHGRISFRKLVTDNIDYLIQVVSDSKIMPICLVRSEIFRDECIKKDRLDLAILCIIPPYIMEEPSLASRYAKELEIDPENLKHRAQWLFHYYERNHDIFQTIVGTSFRDSIFQLPEEHYERFINDITIQMEIAKLTDKELSILKKILELYDYQEYDISSMIVNIIQNIKDYPELIDTISANDLSNHEIRSLVSVLQLSKNPFRIHSLGQLENYQEIKRKFFIEEFDNHDLDTNKDLLLAVLFNISFQEAKYIWDKYCHQDKNVLEQLKESELSSTIYHYFVLIGEIVECQDQEMLFNLYQQQNEEAFYKGEIPLEPYIRSQYTKLYSKSLYKVDEGEGVYGPKDHISSQFTYHNHTIPVYFPRTNFKFFIHCLGHFSEETTDNYMTNWMEMPQLQDHFVACSYISEKGIYSSITDDNVVLAFDSLEGGSILAMGRTDIDSYGSYASSYNGSREVQQRNGQRARFFLPQKILKTVGYNEIVIERRNTEQLNRKHFKRKPDYIIMRASNMDPSNFLLLETLYQTTLSFLSVEDQEEIKKVKRPKELLALFMKYNDFISQQADHLNIPLSQLLDSYIQSVRKAKYYESCIKAASDFNIPLVVIDEDYYFHKLLSESSVYDEETKLKISSLFQDSGIYERKKIFERVSQELDLTDLLNASSSTFSF